MSTVNLRKFADDLTNRRIVSDVSAADNHMAHAAQWAECSEILNKPIKSRKSFYAGIK
jgi:hypothetical protein